jgi:Flp pilus assembly protein TadG
MKPTRLGGDDGAVAVLTAVLALLLFSVAALVVDLGIARDNRRQAQNTADAAALAASNALYGTDQVNRNQPGNFQAAVDAAKDYAEKNYGTSDAEWNECTSSQALPYVYPGTRTNCISFDQSPYPNNVLVQVPLRKQPTFFGGVLGYSGTTISAIAQARINPGGKYLCTFCVVGDMEHRLQNGELNVVGGNMWFNGNVDLGPNGQAGSVPGTVLGEDGELYTDGGNVYVSGDVTGTATNLQGGKAKPKSPRIVDPLAAFVLPFATQSSLTGKTNPCAEGPGIYDGYKLTGGTCSLRPGLYVFTGDLELAGNPSTLFNADGVTMYFTCGSGTVPAACPSTGDEGGGIKVTGNGTYNLTAPYADTFPMVPEELYGYSIVYDRYNEADIFLAGNGTQSITGTIYAMNAKMDNRGNGCSTVTTSLVVVADVGFSGENSCFTAVFDSTKNVKPSDGGRGLVR